VHWVHRVGMDYIKQRVLEDEAGRKAAYARLRAALDMEKDPWIELAKKGAERHEFETLTV
jgi:nitrite reductase (NADH) large subunit